MTPPNAATDEDVKALREAMENLQTLDPSNIEAMRTVMALAPSLLQRIERDGAEIATARETNKRLNRRAQKAESELSKLRKAVPAGGSWESAERRREAKERDAGMAAVAKAEERSKR